MIIVVDINTMKALITKVFRIFSENDRLMMMFMCFKSKLPHYLLLLRYYSLVFSSFLFSPESSITSSRSAEHLGALLQLVQEVCLLLCGGQCSVNLGPEYGMNAELVSSL